MNVKYAAHICIWNEWLCKIVKRKRLVKTIIFTTPILKPIKIFIHEIAKEQTDIFSANVSFALQLRQKYRIFPTNADNIL